MISRLERSWSEVIKQDMETFQSISKVLALDFNFAGYREKLKNVAPDTPCIPRVEVVLKDLTFAEENEDLSETGGINFTKIYKISKALSSIHTFQKQSNKYLFHENDKIQELLQNIRSPPEEELDKESNNLKLNKERGVKIEKSQRKINNMNSSSSDLYNYSKLNVINTPVIESSRGNKHKRKKSDTKEKKINRKLKYLLKKVHHLNRSQNHFIYLWKK